MGEHVELTGWTHLASGKVRDIYAPDGEDPAGADALLMVTSDRISAYDHVLPTTIPGKGKILNQMAIWWMGELRGIVDNHLLAVGRAAPANAADALAGAPRPPLRAVPDAVDARAVVCRRLDMVPIECVVRGYLTGSGLAEYRRTGTVCGIALPDGLTEGSRLDTPVFTPAAKAGAGEHDENITFERAAAMVGRELAGRLRDASLALYERARGVAAERGVIIADTKFEFGVSPDAGSEEIILGDEVLTPDSSRFWIANVYEPGRSQRSLDKQFVRDWLSSEESGWDVNSGTHPPALPDEVVDKTHERYVQIYERLTGSRWS